MNIKGVFIKFAISIIFFRLQYLIIKIKRPIKSSATIGIAKIISLFAISFGGKYGYKFGIIALIRVDAFRFIIFEIFEYIDKTKAGYYAMISSSTIKIYNYIVIINDQTFFKF